MSDIKVKIKLEKLRELVKSTAEAYRVSMEYGCNVKYEKGFLFTKKEIHTPYNTWQEAWRNMVDYHPWNQLRGVMNSRYIEKEFLSGEVEISLAIAGRLGYSNKGDVK